MQVCCWCHVQLQASNSWTSKHDSKDFLKGYFLPDDNLTFTVIAIDVVVQQTAGSYRLIKGAGIELLLFESTCIGLIWRGRCLVLERYKAIQTPIDVTGLH
jgi:hypothetical protein